MSDPEQYATSYNRAVHGGQTVQAPFNLPMVHLDPATVRAVAEQVQKLLEDIVRENPDHPWL